MTREMMNAKADTPGVSDPGRLGDHERMFEMIMAAWLSQTVRTLAELSIAEHLADGPLTAHQLAERESCHPPAMHRLLRAAAALGLTRYDRATRAFAACPLLQILDGRQAGSQGHQPYQLIEAHRASTRAKCESVRQRRRRASKWTE